MLICAMEYVFALGGTITLVAVLIAMKYPIYALQKRFKKFDIELSSNEAKKLSNFYSLDNNLLVEIKSIIDIDDSVSIVSLADFYRVHGDFVKLKDAISEVKKSDKSIPINSLILLLMTNKSVKKALELVAQTYKIEVRGLKEEGFTVDYEIEFKIEYEQSLWLVNNLDLITNTVKSTISLCIVSLEEKEKKKIESEIIKNYLNEDFWMANASAVIINQKVKVI